MLSAIERGLAGGEIDALERGLVAAHRGLQQRGLARELDADEAAGQRILLTDAQHADPLVAHATQQLRAVGVVLRRDARLEIEVEVVAGDFLRVLLDQRALARGEVHFPQVVPFGHAIVDANGNDAGLLPRQAHDLGAHTFIWSEVLLGSGDDVDGVEMKVLVTALVLDEQHVFVVERPEVLADAALLIVGDGLGGIELAALGEPHVEHAVARRDERYVFAVGRETPLGLFGIAEQRRARNDRGAGDGLRGGARRLRGGNGRKGERGHEGGENCFHEVLWSGSLNDGWAHSIYKSANGDIPRFLANGDAPRGLSRATNRFGCT